MRPLIEVMSEAMHDLGDWNPQESAEYVAGRLRAAGFRILGPDEVDPVTLERAAEAAYEEITDGERAEEVAAARRALGRKA